MNALIHPHKNLSNKNLTLTTDSYFQGLKVYSQRGPLVGEYLWSIKQVIDQSLRVHPRTLVIRVDLRFPDHYPYPIFKSEEITRFIKSFKAQVEADIKRKKREGIRVRDCDVNYVWVKEYGQDGKPHYHIALFLNKDTYSAVGAYRAVEGNTASRIRKAWASALGLTIDTLAGCVHFPDNCEYRLEAKAGGGQVYQDLFYRLSYFAKAETKQYQESGRSFGTSRR